jgi:YD repeat-containing protein
MRQFKKSRLLCLMAVVLYTGFIYGQDMPNITPPPPEAASLGKFIEIPVSHYTGLPNINVPIYTIEQDGVSIPVGLSYHARGVQVEEIASRVGIGWALNCGGMITRQIRGPVHPILGPDYVNFFNEEDVRRNEIHREALGLSYDRIPDQFYYSTPDNSGKFIFDYKDGNPVLQKFEDVKIERRMRTPGDSDIEAFLITDKLGNKYYYGYTKDWSRSAVGIDRTLQNYSFTQDEGMAQLPSNDSPYPSTWQLVEIETSVGSMIQFMYEHENTNFYRKSYDKLEYVQGQDEVPNLYKKISYFSDNTSKQYQLKEIIFDKGKVVFTPSSIEREDLELGYALDQVVVYNLKNEPIKKQAFKYVYSTGNPNDSNVLPYLKLSDTRANKRLFLNKIEEQGINSTEKKSYQFEYSSITLPNRFSTSQDVWGYYNNANNGEFLTFSNDGIIETDRSVSSTYSMAGLLTKMTYPTGGYVQYTYEDNKTVTSSKLRDIQMNNPTPVHKLYDGVSNLESVPYYNGAEYTKPFILGQNLHYGRINIECKFTDQSGCPTGYELGCKFDVWVAPQVGTPGNPFKVKMGKHLYLNMIPGNYVLKVKPRNHVHDPYDMMDGFNVIIDWEEDMDSPAVIYSGGKRIKKIDHFESENTTPITKEYTYVDSAGITSGRLFGLPQFLPLKEVIGNFEVFYAYGNVPGSPLSTYQGNTTGYVFVTEYLGGLNSNIGKTEYTFTGTDDTGMYWRFPIHVPTDNEWLRGKPLTIKQYQFNNGSYILKKKIKNEYLYGDDYDLDENTSSDAIFTPIPIYKPITEDLEVPSLVYRKDRARFQLPLYVFVRPPNDNIPDCCVPDHYYKTFHLTGGTVDLWKTEETNYFDNGTELKTNTQYFNNYEKHYQVKSVKTTSSANETVETKYFYPQDTEMSSKPFVSDLKDKHIVTPLVTQTLRNNVKLSEQETVYKNWGNGILLPEIIKTAKGEQGLENRIKYNLIDNTNGNPLEVQLENGVRIVYIWGYNKTQPIAKIENATYADVQSQVANLQNLSNVGEEPNLIVALNNLRTALPNAMVTTYTYKPLIGVSTITDPKGNKTTYDYDEFNRLKQVKDNNNHVLSKNEYHYKN